MLTFNINNNTSYSRESKETITNEKLVALASLKLLKCISKSSENPEDVAYIEKKFEETISNGISTFINKDINLDTYYQLTRKIGKDCEISVEPYIENSLTTTHDYANNTKFDTEHTRFKSLPLNSETSNADQLYNLLFPKSSSVETDSTIIQEYKKSIENINSLFEEIKPTNELDTTKTEGSSEDKNLTLNYKLDSIQQAILNYKDVLHDKDNELSSLKNSLSAQENELNGLRLNVQTETNEQNPNQEAKLKEYENLKSKLETFLTDSPTNSSFNESVLTLLNTKNSNIDELKSEQAILKTYLEKGIYNVNSIISNLKSVLSESETSIISNEDIQNSNNLLKCKLLNDKLEKIVKDIIEYNVLYNTAQKNLLEYKTTLDLQATNIKLIQKYLTDDNSIDTDAIISELETFFKRIDGELSNLDILNDTEKEPNKNSFSNVIDKVVALKNAFSELENNYSNLQDQQKIDKVESEGVKEELKLQEILNNQLLSNNLDQKTTIENKDSKINELESNLDALNEEISQKNIDYNELDNKFKALQKSNNSDQESKLKEQQEASFNELSAKQETITDLQFELASLRAQTVEFEKNIDQLQEELTSKDKNNEENKITIDGLNQKFSGLMKKLRENESHQNVLTTENKTLNEKILTLGKNLKKTTNSLKEKEKTIKNNEQSIEDLNKTKSDQENQIEFLKNENEKLKLNLIQFQEGVVPLSTYTNLQQEYNNLEHQLRNVYIDEQQLLTQLTGNTQDNQINFLKSYISKAGRSVLAMKRNEMKYENYRRFLISTNQKYEQAFTKISNNVQSFQNIIDDIKSTNDMEDVAIENQKLQKNEDIKLRINNYKDLKKRIASLNAALRPLNELKLTNTSHIESTSLAPSIAWATPSPSRMHSVPEEEKQLRYSNSAESFKSSYSPYDISPDIMKTKTPQKHNSSKLEKVSPYMLTNNGSAEHFPYQKDDSTGNLQHLLSLQYNSNTQNTPLKQSAEIVNHNPQSGNSGQKKNRASSAHPTTRASSANNKHRGTSARDLVLRETGYDL